MALLVLWFLSIKYSFIHSFIHRVVAVTNQRWRGLSRRAMVSGLCASTTRQVSQSGRKQRAGKKCVCVCVILIITQPRRSQARPASEDVKRGAEEICDCILTVRDIDSDLDRTPEIETNAETRTWASGPVEKEVSAVRWTSSFVLPRVLASTRLQKSLE